MALHKPLVIVSGQLQQLPTGDSIESWPTEYNAGIDPIVASFSGDVLPLTGAHRYYHPSTTTIVSVYASVGTPSSVGSIAIDVNVNGTSILGGSPVTIAQGAYVGTPVSISQAITSSDYITIDIDAPGSGAKDLNVYLAVEATMLAQGLHASLTGLDADDHTQYHTDARGDARYSLLAHNHAGTYEPVDATILRDADIGVDVAAYSHPHPTKIDRIGFPVDSDGAYLTTLTYNETTRTVTISPTGADFKVYAGGAEYTKTAESLAHADTHGGHFFYYNDSGTLTYSTTPWNLLRHAPVAYVFWDATNNRALCFNERHHAGRDIYWHRNQHTAEGTKATSGFGATGYTLNDGDADTAVTFAIATGRVEDEDIRVDTQALPDDGPYTIMYRTGASGDWVIDRSSVRPFKDTGSAIQYNQWTGATWQLTAVTEDYFVNYYVFGTTAIPTTDYTPSPTTTQQVIIVPGQSIYSSEAAAHAESVGGLSWGSVPFQEVVPLYQVTFRYNASPPQQFTNTTRCAIVRFQRIVGTSASISQAALADHGSLAGLSDDDHAQYHTDARGDARYSLLGHDHSGVYEPVLTAASQAEMEAGTEAALRSMSPLRVAQAIAALSGSGGTLGALSDVTITTPSTDDVLKYNGSIWVNAPAPAGASALDDLTDVTITTPATNHFLKYSGTEWVNALHNVASLSDWPAGVSTTEVGYLDGVTSAIQTQFTDKVSGPASAVNSNLAAFNGTTGKLIKDSGKAYPTGVIVGTTDTQTLTNKTFTGFTETVYGVSGTAPALDPGNGTIQTWTLTGNSTPSYGSIAAGESILLMIDDGAGYTVTWTGVTWIGNTAPTLDTTGYNVFVIWKVSTTTYIKYVGGTP